MSASLRQRMGEPKHAAIIIVQQCLPLTISRSSLYYEAKGESLNSLLLMQEIDRAFTQ